MHARKKRELVDYARRYSIGELGLNVGHAFESEDYTIYGYYVVAWSPRTSLRLYKRTVDYKTQASVIKRMKNASSDAYMRLSEAVSGDCPITKSLLELSPQEVAYSVVHEKWHDFVDVHSVKENLMIEEATADAMGMNESINIIRSFCGGALSEYKATVKQRKERLTDSGIIRSLANSLNELYGSGEPEDEILREKERIFAEFNKSKECETLGRKIRNNAELLDDYLYLALYPLADDVYRGHKDEARDIFIASMKAAKEKGFRAGVDEMARHSYLDREYGRVIDIFRDG